MHIKKDIDDYMNDQFIQGVIFDWDRIDNDSYLKKIAAFHGVKKLDFNKPITFFVGENGSGKSTLLEAIAIAHGFNPEGGTKNSACYSMYDIFCSGKNIGTWNRNRCGGIYNGEGC